MTLFGLWIFGLRYFSTVDWLAICLLIAHLIIVSIIIIIIILIIIIITMCQWSMNFDEWLATHLALPRFLVSFITARRYASAVYAIIVCMSVHLYLSRAGFVPRLNV